MILASKLYYVIVKLLTFPPKWLRWTTVHRTNHLLSYQPKTEVQKPWIFNSEHLKIILCQNELFSFTGDPSFVVRELFSLKSSTKFLWPFSLVNPVMLTEMFSTFQKTWKKIFETEISAHVGCALGTPNFLDLVGINPTTSSLNRIFVTFFLEKKSGEGKNSHFYPPRAEKRRFFGFCLGLLSCVTR